MLRNIVVPIFAVTCLSSTFADTEFQGSVPLELVKALLGNTSFGEPTIYSDLSSAFPEIDVPNELEIMGSIERGYGIAAVYSTRLTDSQARSALSEAFVQAGYMEFELPGMNRVRSGFVASNTIAPQAYNRFCHDSQGFLSHSYTEKNQRSTVTIAANPASDNRSCADQLAEQLQAMGRMGGRRGGLQQYLPIMELPETEPRRYSPFSGIGGYSGSRSGIETGASLSIDWEIEEVFNHFSDQISGQEWVVDSQNIGSSSATGSWTHSPEPGTDLIGTLTVLNLGEESFELKFQLTSLGGNNNTSFGVFRAN